MKEKELISVVMSTYNEPANWIKTSINSILNQSYENIELIVVCDNPGNKELVNLLNEYKENKKVKLIINEENIGLTKSLNKALKFADGEFIARMDSDDIAKKDRLIKQYNYLTENNLDLIGGGVTCIDENEKVISTINNLPKNNDGVKKRIIKNSCVPHPTWFGRKKVFSILNGYRDVAFAEDYDFLLRALSKGFKLGNINEIGLKYRIRSGSISNNNGLKQFITSRELVRLYEEDKILNDITYVKKSIGEKLAEVKKEDEEKYYEASKMFTEGCIGLKSFNIKEATKIPRAIVKSKDYRQKIGCYIKGLL